jgi:PKD repeat protein
MQAKALMVATAMIALALAGCTSEPSTLTIEYDAPDDPITGAFSFTASGPGDSYRWNFGDGTPSLEGANVEHTFGFTDGTVRVSLQGVFENGDPSKSTSVDIMLGSGVNADPVYDFRANSEWLIPGETLTLSTLGTTDSDGDPILTRFECSFNPALGTPHIDNDPDSGQRGAVPIDVDAWVTFDSSIPVGEPVSGDFCATYDFETDQQFSQTGAISGVLTATGGYTFNVEITDPKTNTPFRARAQIFVTDDRPAEMPVFELAGTLSLGFIGTPAATACQLDASLCANAFSDSFKLIMPLSNGTVSLELTDAQSTATFTVFRGTTQVASGAQGDVIDMDDFDDPTTLNVEVVYGFGAGSDYSLKLTGEYSIEPYLAYGFLK